MTDPQTAALEALLTRVEAGELPPPKMIVDAFGVRRLPNGWNVIALVRWIEEGGLEAMGAAKALHEAVLPGWRYGFRSPLEDEDGGLAWVVHPRVDKTGANARNANPARAWLIAILRALISTPADTEGR